MIALEALTKRFGPLVAVDGITMRVARGEVLGFLGRNGAGKSTTMKMVTGFLAPTSGSASVCGHDVSVEPVQVKRRIGYLPEGSPAYGDMTPAAFLGFISAVRGYDGTERRRRVDAVVDKVDLGSVLDQPVETLSKGFKCRVGLAQAFLHDPEVLILDEPTDGLDPNQKHHVRTLIREMAPDKAVVISTHILEEVEAVCSRAVIIESGRLLADGTPDDLLARSPYHNAVRVTVDADAAPAAQREIEALAAVGRVEAVDGTGRGAALRVVPRDGRSIAADIGGLLRDKGYAVHEMFTEKGALDDVFRDITTGAAATGNARDA